MTRGAGTAPPAVLKTGARRTVTREVVDGVPRIVKRFHAPGLLDRVADRYRARREHAALARLQSRGLPVPHPVGVRRREGRWELVLEDLEDSLSLADVLDGRAAWPAPPLDVAAGLGRLLAALVRCDVHHGDLHAGNVLIDPRGRARLIDLAHVRVGGRVDHAPLLVSCAAGLRERDPRGFRARALAAFLQDAGGRGDIDPDRLEHDARLHRRGVVRRRIARYWRESGALRSASYDGVRGLLARDVDADRLPALDDEPAPPGHVSLRAASLAHLSERWERAARGRMHLLPIERPVALIHAPRPRAVLARPDLAPAGAAGTSAIAKLLGAVHDRGLRLAGEARDLGTAPDGTVWIRGGTFHEHDELEDIGWVRGWFARLGRRPGEEAIEAFLAAGRGTKGERARLAARWRTHG